MLPDQQPSRAACSEYTNADSVIRCFRGLVAEMSPSERRQLLLFYTGCMEALPSWYDAVPAQSTPVQTNHAANILQQHGDHGCTFMISRVPMLDPCVLSILP